MPAESTDDLGVGGLLGRDSEIEEIASAIAGTRDGRGSLLLLEGPAGIGKTALTWAAIEIARREGLTPLAARGNEGETDLPYGLARQLLEPPLVHDAERRARILTGSAQLAAPILFLEPGTGIEGTGKPEPEPMAMLHGLFWVCSNLGEEGPLLFVADDLHWADPPSMRFVTYLANRIADLPVVLVAAYRTGEPIDRVALDAIASLSVTTVIAPQALSLDDSTSLVEAAYDTPAAPEFAGACHEASGGNPFLLDQLLKSLVAEGTEPSAESARRVAESTPAEVLRSVGARLRRLPPHAQSLAEALAVAGADVTLATAIAGLSAAESTKAADALAASGLVTGSPQIDFAHPLIRTTVYERLGPGERIRAHALAAETLAGSGESDERIAGHLLHVPAAADRERVRVLMLAGHNALARGAPEAAVGYLRRALEEPPPEHERGGVLFELGRAEGMLAAEESLAHLGEAAELAADPMRRIEVLREIAYASAANFGLVAQAHETLDQARLLAAGMEPELELQLQAEQATWAVLDSGRHLGPSWNELEESGKGLDGANTGERAVLALLAFCRMAAARPVPEVVAPAVVALRDGLLAEELGGGSLTVAAASWALAFTGSRAELDREQANHLRLAAEEGSRHGTGIHLMSAAAVAWSEGRLRDAEAYAKDSLEAVLEVNSVGASASLTIYVGVLRDLGRADTGWRKLEELNLLGELPPFWPFSGIHISRGLLRADRGDLDGAIADIDAAAAIHTGWGFVNPEMAPWRSAAAAVHLLRGETERAQQLAEEDLEISRRGELPGATGRALRLLGLCAKGDECIELLRESVKTLEPTTARLEYARALVELGAALRRENRRGLSGATLDEAREKISEGMDIASRAGARAIAERAQVELRATGARPRRTVVSGPDSLTASERRVAQLAAEGRTNREIAESLFVTLKTVEKHLGNTYAKLDIGGRGDLAAALGSEAFTTRPDT